MSSRRTDHPLVQHYAQSVPHCGQMGQEIVWVERDKIRLRQPFFEHLIGDLDRRLIHTSVLLTMVDSGFGAAVLNGLRKMETIATMDLRMDYFRPAVADQDLYLDAHVDRVSRQVVFVSGEVWQGSEDNIVAIGRAAFMRSAVPTPSVIEQAEQRDA